MAGRIKDEDVKAVREAAHIEDVVGEHLQLRNAGGGNLKGLCPFHDEKSPSFNVNPSKNVFHCFGCQEGGDVLSFLMKIDHLTFAEAVERLAAQVGIQLRYEEGGYTPGRQQGERTRLVEAHKAAAAYFIEQLTTPEAEPARAFLAGRGFDESAAAHFSVGYSPKGWENLVRHLRGLRFSDAEILKSGLGSEGRRGPMDRFRGRVMWPIRDTAGDIVGFGARKLYDDDNGPKYLNTPETPIYKKSQVLYGLDLAKKEIAKSGRAVLVEGYTDVMAAHLAGVTTAVATSGTAFGADHIKVLRRLLMDKDNSNAEVIFTFDGDAAGQKAALRAFEEDQKFVARTFVAVEPDGMDPCDLRMAKGDQAVRDLIEARIPLFEFAIRSTIERHNLETAEGRVAALDAAAPIVAEIKDQSLRHTYAVQLDHWLGYLDERFVVGRVAQLARWKRERGRTGPPEQQRRTEPQQQAPPQPRRFRPDPHNRAHAVQRELLKLAIQHPVLVQPAFDFYEADEFTVPPYAAVRTAIAAAGGVAGPVAFSSDWVDAVRAASADDTVRGLVIELAVEAMFTTRKPDEVYAGGYLVQLRIMSVESRMRELRSQASRLDPRREPEQVNAVYQDLAALEQYRRALKDQGVAAL